MIIVIDAYYFGIMPLINKRLQIHAIVKGEICLFGGEHKMKVFWNIFINSIKLPQKQATFTLNRVGMDVIIIYMFIMLAFASIPDLLVQIQTNATSVFYVQLFSLFIFFFIFYYLFLVFIVFASLSVIAYVGGLIARATKRKLRYQVLWKTAACITTIPILLFTVISFFYAIHTHTLFLVGMLLFHFIIFIRSILLYPKRRMMK